MNEILCRQLALDYCSDVADVRDEANHFTVYEKRDGRRRFQESSECRLKIAVVNGKLLFTGEAAVVEWCRERYRETDSEWFFEPSKLREIDVRLAEDGYRIATAHPFFIAEKTDELPQGEYGLRWYRGRDIEQFRGDERFSEAYAFDGAAPDMIGVAATEGSEILGMAGASCDSPTMWQIGIDVMPRARGRGIGAALVATLKNELLEQGILPFYGTSMSHIASQRVAIAAGFYSAWAEMVAEATEGQDIK